MDEKQKDKKKQEQPVTVNITNNNQFQKGVGAFITNLNHLTIVMDSEGNIKMEGVEASIMPHKEDAKDIGWIVSQGICTLEEEGLLLNLYDYTWVMEAMNQTDGMPSFKSPASFISYLRKLGISRLPSEDSINRKQNTFTGKFPEWVFIDCDTTEATRRINIGKRFLNICRMIR